MKKTVLLSLTLLMTLTFLTACGVPQKDYDKLASDLATAQAEIIYLQRANDVAMKKLSDAQARVEVLNAMLIPALTGKLYQMTQIEVTNFLLDSRDKVIVIGDATLTRRFETFMYTYSAEASNDFYFYLLKSIEDLLR